MPDLTLRRRTVLGGMLGSSAAMLAGPLALPAWADASTDELRLRWHTLLTGGPTVDPSDPDLAVAIARIDKLAKSALTTLDRTANRTTLWPDLASTTLSNHVASNFRRIKQIAVAWGTTGSSYVGNTQVAADVLGALEWMYANRYSPTLPRYDNDYDWEIGGASALADTLVLLYDVIDPAMRSTYTAAINHYTPDPNLWRADRQIATGANRVWIATVVAVRAVLDGDTAALTRVRDAISDVEGSGANSVLAFNDAPGRIDGTGEGFYSDGAFLQHWKHPYNGGYGKELLGTLSSLLYLLGGTQWTVTDPDLDNIYHWIDDAFDPLMARGDLMGSVCGREIARPSKQNHAPTQTVIEGALRLIPAAPPDRAERLTALVKQWITEDTFRDFLTVTDPASLVAARAVLGSGTPARGPLVLHKQYPRMDKVAHHRPGFTIGLSAYSSRIYNYESIQTENLHGWHLSDGMVLVYDDDLGHYSGDYWPTVDPYRLPGTTVDTRRLADSYGFRSTSAADWVGGAAVPGTTIGAYGMDLRGHGTGLTALKSWFLIDDVMVCLGSDITGPGVGRDDRGEPQAPHRHRGVRPGTRLLPPGRHRRLRLPGQYAGPRAPGEPDRDVAGDQPQVRHRHPGDQAVPDGLDRSRCRARCPGLLLRPAADSEPGRDHGLRPEPPGPAASGRLDRPRRTAARRTGRELLAGRMRRRADRGRPGLGGRGPRQGRHFRPDPDPDLGHRRPGRAWPALHRGRRPSTGDSPGSRLAPGRRRHRHPWQHPDRHLPLRRV